MAETRFNPPQIQIAKHSTAIVGYLREISKHYKHIGEAFECANGRLFFNMDNINFPAEAELAFGCEEVDEYFWRKIEIIGITISEHALRFVEKTFVHYFFDPIEESNAWYSFWAEQSLKIRDTQRTTLSAESRLATSPRSPRIELMESPEEKAQKIKNMIAGALAYKIQCVVTKNDPARQKQLIKTLDVYTKIVNSIHDPKKVITEEPDTAKSSFMGELDLLAANIADKTISQNEITNRTRKAIDSIREKNKHYNMAQDNQKILYECLINLLKKPQIREENQKKIAGAILLDLNEYYGKKLVIAPAFLFGIVQTVLPYCSDDKKESCPEIIAWYDAMEKAQLSFRKSFEIPKPQPSSASTLEPNRPDANRPSLSPQPERRVHFKRTRSKSFNAENKAVSVADLGTFTLRKTKLSSKPSETEENTPNSSPATFKCDT